MKIDEMIECVCRDLQGITNYEKKRLTRLYGHFAQFDGVLIEFDIPVELSSSGNGVEIAGVGCHNPVRLKFSLTFWGAFSDGPTNGEAEANAADG